MRNERHQEVQRELVAQYRETGEGAWENLKLWLDGEMPFVPADALRQFVEGAPLDLIHESFWRNLPFGTGGVRGTVGFGPNRINHTVVALTIQAHCNFINRFLETPKGAQYDRSVVVANDVRKFLDSQGVLKFLNDNPYHAEHPGGGVTSRQLAYLAAEIYAANGIVVYLLDPHDDKALLTTPELSYLIRRLNAAGGINISASHNPPDDNGVKVYDENGGQYLPPHDQELTDETRNIHTVSHMPFAEAVDAEMIRNIPAEALADYMSLYIDRAEQRGLRSAKGTKVLFTPLSGCGGRTVERALRELGYDVKVPLREGPDGTFRNIPLHAPNPEVPESTGRAKGEAMDFGAELVLATDPDADRLGVEVYHRDAWVHLTGNQLGTILAYYLLLDPEGPRLRGGVYQTIVTTLAVKAIAEQAGASPIRADLLVGFKYVGKAVLDYQSKHADATDDDLLAFACEESHGYLDTPNLRDKDAMAGALHLAKLHERLTDRSQTLVDYLHTVYERVGYFGDRGRSIVILGSSGVSMIRTMMQRLRGLTGPIELGGQRITSVTDYLEETGPLGKISSATDREARNVLVFTFDGGQVTFRPSGTEPKLKFYVQTSDSAQAQDRADQIGEAIYLDLVKMMGRKLDPAFANLPDVISLDSKIELHDRVVPELRELITSSDQEPGFVADWLNQRVSALVQGESALDIVSPALRSAISGWGPSEIQQVEAILTAPGK